jgi:hypothetical protein
VGRKEGQGNGILTMNIGRECLNKLKMEDGRCTLHTACKANRLIGLMFISILGNIQLLKNKIGILDAKVYYYY